eukprot:gene17740-9408_t
MAFPCSGVSLELTDASSYILNSYACAIFNLVLAVPTTLLNTSFIVAVLKSSDRAEPHQILMLNLAITDLLTGIVSMPSQFILFLHHAHLKDTCSYAGFAQTFSYFLGIVSLLTLTAVATERYVFIFNPHLHNAKLTSCFLIVIVIGTWMASIAVSILFLFSGVKNAITACIGVLASGVIFFCYTRIMIRARRIRRQIAAEAERFGQRRVNKKDKNLLVDRQEIPWVPRGGAFCGSGTQGSRETALALGQGRI